MRANFVVYASNGFPEITVNLFRQRGGKAEAVHEAELVETISMTLRRRNLEAAVGELLTIVQKWPDLAVVIEMLRAIIVRLGHLDVSMIEIPEQVAENGAVTRTFSFQFQPRR